MEKISKKKKSSGFERKSLLILTILFCAVLGSAWFYAMQIKQSISAKNAIATTETNALIEVERIRNLVANQFDGSLTFFLMGSTNLFDEQKKIKNSLAEALVNFEKQYNLPQVSDIIKHINAQLQQRQEFFDQGMEFRAKQTESKIIGQFYRSKTNSLRSNINKDLDEIVTLHNSELDLSRKRAKEAAREAEVQIPEGMTWLSGLFGFLFLCMSFLILRLISKQERQVAERSRLYNEAQQAILSRDEAIAAISQDLNEPLAAIAQTVSTISNSDDKEKMTEKIEIVESSVVIIKDRVKDILDQTNADMNRLTLRLDQRGLDTILEEAKLILQPLAKQKDIRLEFHPVNPPVLAFLDTERVMRVLSNLVGNAIKFSPNLSKIIVKVRSDQQFVFVSVKDAGPGIPEKQLPHLFDHFWQASKTSEQGPGVGLAVVKTIIEAHGGVVSVESHVGHGSTFTFSLPRRRPSGLNMGKQNSITVRSTAKPQAEFKSVEASLS